jgi:NADH:ubiquinone oxidoreductase subunit 6 (subunit J)
MEWLFLVVSFIAVLSAGMMLTRQNAVHSALFLIVNFGCVAFLYLMLDAPFLAMVQVAVYAGAIMVLFLFVIMLLGAEITTDTSGQMRWLSFAGAGVAVLILVIFGFPIVSGLLNDDGLEAHTGSTFVRVINAVPSEELAVTTTFDALEEGVEDVTVEQVTYNSEETSYLTLPAGEYTVTVMADAETLYSEDVLLETNVSQSIIAYSGAEESIAVTTVEDDLSPTEMGTMRLSLFNTVADSSVSLIDIGQYSSIRTLCESSTCTTLIPHRVLIDALPVGEALSLDFDEGTYNLAFVNEDNDVLRSLQGFDAERGAVETRVFVLEPGLDGAQAVHRAAVFSAVASPSFGSPEAIGQVLFIDYLLPVQLVGILLLVALIGVIVLARPDALAQAERRRVNSRRRVSRPLVSVLSQQTGADVLSGEYQAKLTEGSDDDPQAK